MKRDSIIRIGTCLLFLLLPCLAVASSPPPVSVNLVGDVAARVPGKAWEAELSIATAPYVTVTDFRLEGSGWTLQRFDPPPTVTKEKGAMTTVPITVTGVAGAGDLVFRCLVDGNPYERRINLDPEYCRRLVEGFPTRSLAGHGAPPRVAPHLLAIRAEPVTPQPETKNATKDRDIRVHGRFCYLREDGEIIGADGLEAHVYDGDPGIDDLLGVVTTDAEGNYDITVGWDPQFGDDDPDIYILFRCQNSHVNIRESILFLTYGFRTQTWANFTGTDLDVGLEGPGSENDNIAVHIMTNLMRHRRWCGTWGYYPGQVNVNWPDDATNYSDGTETIRIEPDRGWDASAQTHEYGHHLHHEHVSLPYSEYCNEGGFADDGDDCTHKAWCRENDVVAFKEGFANFNGDIVPETFAADYGLAALPGYHDSYEDLNDCGEDHLYHDPWITEGFFAAVLRDIVDDTQIGDDHPHYPGFSDALELPVGHVLHVLLDRDAARIPGFFDRLYDEYPLETGGLWETAMNCGYDLDEDQPDTVVGLTSTSHTAGVPSTQTDVHLEWGGALDDASGVVGYGLYLSSNNPARPGATMDIGRETSHIEAAVLTGTWYFNIRSVDRSGKWDDDYVSYGPIIIEEAAQCDLASHRYVGWDDPLVLRNTDDATISSVHMPTGLDTELPVYWNAGGINSGSASSPVKTRAALRLNGEREDDIGVLELAAGQDFPLLNLGPLMTVPGRHTVSLKLDADYDVVETSEANNIWGRQLVFMPYDVPTVPNVTMFPKPPLNDAGWEEITDYSIADNCYGLRFPSSGWWNAVAVWTPSDPDAAYETRLYDASTSAGAGFHTQRASSGRPAGWLQGVIVNRNTEGDADWDVGISRHYRQESATFRALHVESELLAVGDSVTFTLGAGEYIALREFYVGAADTGSIHIDMTVAGHTPWTSLQYLAPDYTCGGLGDYEAEDLIDALGHARIELRLQDPDTYHCAVIHRQPQYGDDEVTVTLQIENTPPDLEPFKPGGWYAPLVPRPADDGSALSVAVPDTLHGDPGETWFNFAIRNDSNGDCPYPIVVRVDVDGEQRIQTGWFTATTAHTHRSANWSTPYSIPGGRHTVSLIVDPADSVEEIDETNNAFGAQYVWSPFELGPDNATTRPAPPPRTAGWEHVSSGEPLYFNCDGVRSLDATTAWRAVAVMPAAGEDVDLRAHLVAEGARSGFDLTEEYSGWGPGLSELIVVHRNYLVDRVFDAGVLNIDASSSYTIQTATEDQLDEAEGDYGPFLMKPGQIVALYDAVFRTGVVAIEVRNESGSLDWGISVYDPHDVEDHFRSRDEAMEGAIAWLAPGGENESISVQIDSDRACCIAVWKVGAEDLSESGTFSLRFLPGVSDVDDIAVTPAASRLTSVYPNPFNPQTSVAFDLARDCTAEVSVYDLKGARVRLLSSGTRVAGRHVVAWDGRSDDGRRMSSGAYFIRLRAGEETDLRKVMLVK